MRRIGLIGSSAGMALASALLTHNNQPSVQATAGRHRGRESAILVKGSRQLDKTERA